MENYQPLELRMYFFTIYQLKGIQAGIQCGHAALEYAHEYGQSEEFIDFISNWKTWIILNGGTTNDLQKYDNQYIGSLNQIGEELHQNGITFSFFNEPDLNNALTAICFICDERVFNTKKYPDFNDWLLESKPECNALASELHPDFYKEWIRFVGGLKNVFLRELIRDKNLA